MNLAVIGAGYVGLVTAAVFADLENKVTVVEINNDKIEKLSHGEIPFYEPGLDKLISKNIGNKRLSFTKSFHEAIPEAKIIFICVGTPTKNGRADLSYLFKAAKSIAESLKRKSIIVIKSTVPPGTNSKVKQLMVKYTKVDFDLASVPEFLREGKALWDSLHPFRIVIGADKKETAKELLKLHQKIPGKRLTCSPESAQMIKYASNAFLPTKISFANSIAVLCDKYKVNVNEVMKGVGMDKRIGPDFLAAGLGYGGSCFPKDVSALINLAKGIGYDFKILKAVKETNQKQIIFFVNKTVRLCGGSVKGKTIVILGLSFKPETSDMREARSIYVIAELQKRGATIRACDPVAIPESTKIIRGVEFFVDPYEALKGADALLLVTEWEEYRKLDFARVGKIMNSRVVIDGRNIYNKNKMKRLKFVYEGIGQ